MEEHRQVNESKEERIQKYILIDTAYVSKNVLITWMRKSQNNQKKKKSGFDIKEQKEQWRGDKKRKIDRTDHLESGCGT